MGYEFLRRNSDTPKLPHGCSALPLEPSCGIFCRFTHSAIHTTLRSFAVTKRKAMKNTFHGSTEIIEVHQNLCCCIVTHNTYLQCRNNYKKM
jgi:hypothetical protein